MLWVRRCMVFKGPTLTPEEQVAFASHFGPLEFAKRGADDGQIGTGHTEAGGHLQP